MYNLRRKIRIAGGVVAVWLSFAVCPSVWALSPREEILADKMLATSNHRLYPEPGESGSLMAPPAGYTPFHISTYARHGSRFLLNEESYDNALLPLEKGEEAGLLTETGMIVKKRITKVKDLAAGLRYGELTPAGFRQHRGIARRMVSNFPEIFCDSAEIDARSTDVMRCVMSMMAECLEIQKLRPGVRITHDASKADLWKLNDWCVADSLVERYRDVTRREVEKAKEKLDGSRFIGLLFTDRDWVVRNLGSPADLMMSIFFVASNMQSHDLPELDLMWLFTPEECYGCWLVGNVEWYMRSGDTPLTSREMPFQHVSLMREILADGEKSVLSRRPTATLRFGHESVVLPTLVLMEADDFGYVTDKMDTLHEHWAAYRAFPMAANIQIVFYEDRVKPDRAVLVRVLINERDAKLPILCDSAPFYKWKDFYNYYIGKLST